MQKFLSGLVAFACAAPLSISTAIPLNAAPIALPQPAEPSAAIQLAAYEEPWKPMTPWFHRNYHPRDSFYRVGNAYYYNGHRGYPSPRTGYREYDGWWFPSAAFVTGALVTGSVTAAPGMSRSHVAWCRDHYSSYRVSDNSYRPSRGPRRACISP